MGEGSGETAVPLPRKKRGHCIIENDYFYGLFGRLAPVHIVCVRICIHPPLRPLNFQLGPAVYMLTYGAQETLLGAIDVKRAVMQWLEQSRAQCVSYGAQ